VEAPVNEPLLVTIALTPDQFEALAQRVAEIVLDESRAAAAEWLTLEEAAERLRLSPAAARKRAIRGTLPGAVKDGSRWLVDARALAAAPEPPTLGGDHQKRGPRRANGRPPGTEGRTSDA
jgi:hypothetical protein